KKLSAAGFDDSDISEALHWLAGVLRAPHGVPQKLPDSRTSFRAFAPRELAKLDAECRGFLLTLEQSGILNPQTRELVIARSLAGFVRKGDYFESDEYLLSSAVGHLLELAVPDEYEVKKGKWSFKHLPVIPPHFELAPLEKSEQRLNLLLRLMKRRDVSGLINACDAGREGELIFRYIVQHARIKKPIERLWLQSMTPQSIRDGFNSLREDRELLPLADAAKCRSEADWLVGINGTRAMTAFNSKEGGFYLTTVGRVQTP